MSAQASYRSWIVVLAMTCLLLGFALASVALPLGAHEVDGRRSAAATDVFEAEYLRDGRGRAGSGVEWTPRGPFRSP
jgi:hypothetical protein